MAFRRRFTPRRSFGRRRRGGGMRASVPPQRWQAANFSVALQHNHTANPTGPSVNSVVELIKVWEHVGDPNTSDGVALAGLVRGIEVAGIVYSWFVLCNTAIVETATFLGQCWHYLCTASLDAAGNPVNALPDFTHTMVPIVNVGSVTPGSPDDNQWPTRMHHREHRMLVVQQEDLTNAYFVQDTFEERTRRIRLRRRFTDREGLYLGFATQHSLVSNEFFSCFLNGTIYYRVILGR